MACLFFSACCSLCWLCFVEAVPSAAEALAAFCGRFVGLKMDRDPDLAAVALETLLVFLKSATGATGALPFTTSGISSDELCWCFCFWPSGTDPWDIPLQCVCFVDPSRCLALSTVWPRQSLAELLLCRECWESGLAAAGVILAVGRRDGALAALCLLTVVLFRVGAEVLACSVGVRLLVT